MENDQYSLNTPSTESSAKLIRGRLLDQQYQTGIAFAYIEVSSLNLQLSSNEQGYFEFHIPIQFNLDQIELCIMPIYYEYKSLSVDWRKDQLHEITLRAHLDDSLHTHGVQIRSAKFSIWQKIKLKFFPIRRIYSSKSL